VEFLMTGSTLTIRFTNEQTIKIVKGRKAVIAYHDAQADDHAIAWTGSKAIDCSLGEYVNLEDIRIEVVNRSGFAGGSNS
jgi:hypothetical protein